MNAILKRIGLRRLIVIKLMIAIGLSANYFLPPDKAVHVNFAVNLLWLFMF
jgi:hypothetical protein